MSLSLSLSNGSSALEANQKCFDVISNNIGNSNTVGYKSSRANFADQFSQVMNLGRTPYGTGTSSVGGMNPLEFGMGTKLASVSLDMSQGTLESTNRPLDLALQGSGFFVYNDNGKQVYSRAGAITNDKNGNFIDSNTGAYLQGYNITTDANGKAIKDSTGNNIISRKLANLLISPDFLSVPKQTENVTISGNLDAAQTVTSTPRQTSINIFDNQGTSHNLELTFTKTATANQYTVTSTIDGVNVPLSATNITFNNDGTLNTPNSLQITSADLNTALNVNSFDTTKNLKLNLQDPNNKTNASLTQFSGSNTATAAQQDGFQVGTLEGLTVDSQGKVWGSFSNGQTEVLGQVSVSKFTNPAGLLKEGNSFYSVSANSGAPNIGTAGELFPSTKIASNYLEQSNVELTKEFTNIITTQRAFEAAARTVTVSDQMLQEINALKR